MPASFTRLLDAQSRCCVIAASSERLARCLRGIGVRVLGGGARVQTQSTLPMVDRRECAPAAFTMRPARAHHVYDAGGGGVEGAQRTHRTYAFGVFPLACTGNVLLDGQLLHNGGASEFLVRLTPCRVQRATTNSIHPAHCCPPAPPPRCRRTARNVIIQSAGRRKTNVQCMRRWNSQAGEPSYLRSSPSRGLRTPRPPRFSTWV